MKLPHPLVLVVGAMVLLPAGCLFTEFSRSGWIASVEYLRDRGYDDVSVTSIPPTGAGDRTGCYTFHALRQQEDVRGIVCIRRKAGGEPVGRIVKMEEQSYEPVLEP